MEQPSPADDKTGNWKTGNEWSRNSSPPSFIQDLPEALKLVLASLFMALLLHAFFAARRKNINESQGIPSVRGHVGAVGSADASDGLDESNGDKNVVGDDSDSAGNGNGQVLGSLTEEKDEKKQTKRSRNNVANRNYDVLICKREESDEELEKTQAPKAKMKTKASAAAASSGTKSGESKNNNQPMGKKLGSDKKQPNNGEDDAADENDAAAAGQQTSAPPPIELKSKAAHPGLQGYYNWLATTTSLYRIYAIPSYSPDNDRKYHQAILPMHPSSERGQVPLYIEVTNRTSHHIDVYWVDYKGNEIHKGSIPNGGGVWSQTTFIGHPWTFRIGEGEESIVLKYAPFRIVPSIVGAETSRVEPNGNIEATQKFILRDAPKGHVARLNGCAPTSIVEDNILPEPPFIHRNDLNKLTSFSTSEMNKAIQWSCQQIQREDAINHGKGIASAKRLLQYLKNICLHPDDPKYRRLRLGNRIFQEMIYNTGARGVLLALGFEELYGYMECGPGGGRMLSHERIQQISDAMMIVNQALKMMQVNHDSVVLAQPDGADGFGRDGFGHAGGMNL